MIAESKGEEIRNYELKAENNELMLKWVSSIKLCQEFVDQREKQCIFLGFIIIIKKHFSFSKRKIHELF